ncbi:MAG TPA: DUF4397 domain-containing protein [Gemmatimonadales bacterium]|nr:DUF4397 domain-containing protein [Gemmatimonadales bacterium]
MTTSPKRSWIATLLVAATIAGACDKNTVQVLPTSPPLASRIKFFNFGVNAPGVNFYADATKMTAILSATGTEATTGVAYGGVGNGGAYSSIAPASYTLTAKIAATVDKDLAIGTTTATIEDGKFYSWYLSGFYNAAAKTIDGFVVEDPPPALDYTVAQVRLVHAIANANPLSLYRRPAGDTLAAWVLIEGPVSYKSAGAFTAVPMGIYDLAAGYPDSTTKKTIRTNVTLFGGHAYSIGARGDITITSATATNRPFLDNTPNY